MTGIHIIDRHNRSYYQDLLDLYYEKRHQVFVEERGWEDLRRANGRDIDAYDDEHAVYILAVDGSKLVGGQRLYPTLRPHMLSDVFEHLCDRPLPRDATTYEWTRYFVVKERRTGRTDCRLLGAIQQYCLEEGITQLTAVVEMWWLPRWQQAGFKVRPLGFPQIIENQPTTAVVIDVSADSLASVHQMAGLKPNAFLRHGIESERFSNAS